MVRINHNIHFQQTLKQDKRVKVTRYGRPEGLWVLASGDPRVDQQVSEVWRPEGGLRPCELSQLRQGAVPGIFMPTAGDLSFVRSEALADVGPAAQRPSL